MKVTQVDSQDTSEAPVVPKPKTPAYFQMKEYPHDGICQQLTFMLIRPPRFIYNPDIIKPNLRNRKRFTSQTVDIGFQLTIFKQTNMRYIVLYLHGNGSSRFEGNLFLHQLPDEVGLACFDFNGCGNRYEADYITLGQNQSRQVDRAARYLKELGYRVVGWGRSMGGVSLLMSGQIDIMVSDSAYSNLGHLCKESSSKFVPTICCCFFHIFFPCVFSCLKCQVQSKSGLKIDSMDVSAHLKKISNKTSQPKQICFIHGENDKLIPVDNADKLYDSFSGRRQLIIFEGTHNSNRPDVVVNRCFQFIEEGLNSSMGRLPENVRLNKMIQLQEINRGQEKEDPRMVTPVTTVGIKVSNSASSISERNATNVHLHSEYSNGVSHKPHKQQLKDEQYCQAGCQIDLVLKDCQAQTKAPTSFRTVGISHVPQVVRKKNSLSNSKKQEETLRKIFKPE